MTKYFYLDASALAKRYALEIGTPVANYLFASQSHDNFLTLTVGLAEVISILVRKRNAGKIAPAIFSQALLDFNAEIVNAAAVQKLVADNSLVMDALSLIIAHSINATDAVLLRSAIDLAAILRMHGDELILVASDQRLLRAAQTEGLLIFNPETQTIADLNALLI